MSTDAGSPSDKGDNGTAPDSAAIEKLINDAVGRALAARLPRVKNTEETIAKMVADAVAKLAPEKPVEQPVVNPGDADRPTVKSLQSEIESLKKALQAQQKAAQEADARAKDARIRSEFQTRLASKLGADNPLLGTLMDSLYDVKKRVVEGPNGMPAVKFVDQWGNEELKTLEEGVSALFDSELKHLVQQSKASALPPNGYRLGGTPVAQQPQQPKPQGVNPMDMELIEAIGKDRPELAQAMYAHAASLAPQK